MRTLIITLLLMATISVSAQQGRTERGGKSQSEVVNTKKSSDNHKRHIVPPMTDEQANNVVKLVKDTSFDDDKLKVAKVCLSLRPMYAKDIERIAKLIDFEDTRLKFLKYAYGHCIDKRNAYLFRKVLDFSSSKDELDEYIEEYNKKKDSRHGK